MKRRELFHHLYDHGCKLLREGAKHSVFVNPTNNRTSTVPRHREIHPFLADKICKDLGVPKPKRR